MRRRRGAKEAIGRGLMHGFDDERQIQSKTSTMYRDIDGRKSRVREMDRCMNGRLGIMEYLTELAFQETGSRWNRRRWRRRKRMRRKAKHKEEKELEGGRAAPPRRMRNKKTKEDEEVEGNEDEDKLKPNRRSWKKSIQSAGGGRITEKDNGGRRGSRPGKKKGGRRKWKEQRQETTRLNSNWEIGPWKRRRMKSLERKERENV